MRVESENFCVLYSSQTFAKTHVSSTRCSYIYIYIFGSWRGHKNMMSCYQCVFSFRLVQYMPIVLMRAVNTTSFKPSALTALFVIQGVHNPQAVVDNIKLTFVAAAEMLEITLRPELELPTGPALIAKACFTFRNSSVTTWGRQHVRCPNLTCMLDYWRQAIRFGPVFWISGRMGEQSHRRPKMVNSASACRDDSSLCLNLPYNHFISLLPSPSISRSLSRSFSLSLSLITTGCQELKLSQHSPRYSQEGRSHARFANHS